MNKKGQKIKHHTKRKLKVNVLLKLLVFFCLIIATFYYLKTLPIKNIYITGNEQIPDVEIIETLNIKDYPPLYKLKISKLEQTLQAHPLIKNVKIKRNIFGKLTIKITESKILFFYKYNNKYITSEGTSIDNNDKYYGYPTLINFTPDTVFEEFVKGLNKIDHNIINMINEIEYNPYKNADGTIIDNNRFTLKMNDQNTVIIDTVNIKNLNLYNTIYASLGMDTSKGILYLDTITEDNIYFKSYETINNENKDETN